MIEHLTKFPDNIKKGYDLGQGFEIKEKIDKIIVCGMGGSGISGNIIRDYVKNIPVFVNKGYDIPQFIDGQTLAFVMSYSGNTEEVISAYEKIKEKTDKIIIITSGGMLGEEKNILKIPQGLPPRCALPYLFFPLLRVLENSGIIKKDYDIEEIVNNIKNMDIEKPKELASKISNFIPVIYASERYAASAYRWQTQFNENSKTLAHHQVFSEHNHNEMEARIDSRYKVIMLRDDEDYDLIKKRMDITKGMLGSVEEVELKGDSYLSKMFYGIYFGDLVSYYVAVNTNQDPTKIDNIDFLKEKLKS